MSQVGFGCWRVPLPAFMQQSTARSSIPTPLKHGRCAQSCVIAHARKKETEQVAEADDQAATVAAVPQLELPEPILVKSTRSSSSKTRRGRRTTAERPTPTPARVYIQGLEHKLLKTDSNGNRYVDLGCLGDGQPRWYAVGVLEGKEDKYGELLSDAVAQLGAIEDAETGELVDRTLEFWVPQKEMMVYSPNTDKLVPRMVRYKGGGWVYIKCIMDNVMHAAITSTYYYLCWRDVEVHSRDMLLLAGLQLPPDDEQDFPLPRPCSDAAVAAILQWEVTPESEDEEERRREIYGVGGGTIFGVSERRDTDKASTDVDERGGKMYKSSELDGTYLNPSRWSEGPTATQQAGFKPDSNNKKGRGQKQERSRRDNDASQSVDPSTSWGTSGWFYGDAASENASAAAAAPGGWDDWAAEPAASEAQELDAQSPHQETSEPLEAKLKSDKASSKRTSKAGSADRSSSSSSVSGLGLDPAAFQWDDLATGFQKALFQGSSPSTSGNQSNKDFQQWDAIDSSSSPSSRQGGNDRQAGACDDGYGAGVNDDYAMTNHDEPATYIPSSRQRRRGAGQDRNSSQWQQRQQQEQQGGYMQKNLAWDAALSSERYSDDEGDDDDSNSGYQYPASTSSPPASRSRQQQAPSVLPAQTGVYMEKNLAWDAALSSERYSSIDEDDDGDFGADFDDDNGGGAGGDEEGFAGGYVSQPPSDAGGYGGNRGGMAGPGKASYMDESTWSWGSSAPPQQSNARGSNWGNAGGKASTGRGAGGRGGRGGLSNVVVQRGKQQQRGSGNRDTGGYMQQGRGADNDMGSFSYSQPKGSTGGNFDFDFSDAFNDSIRDFATGDQNPAAGKSRGPPQAGDDAVLNDFGDFGDMLTDLPEGDDEDWIDFEGMDFPGQSAQSSASSSSQGAPSFRRGGATAGGRGRRGGGRSR